MNILHTHKNYLICLKPPGMDSEHQLPQLLSEALPGPLYPVHRLDLNVGGLMVFARNQKTAAQLSRQIQDGTFIKEYVALVHGTPAPEDILEDLLFKDSRKNKVFVVKKPRTGVRAAKLAYHCLTSGETSLIQVRLYTGRSHQIRVQFASRGYPLVGDHKYGSRAPEQEPRLYCCRLRFTTPEGPQCFTHLPDWCGVPLWDME